jgi:hypothetical protein
MSASRARSDDQGRAGPRALKTGGGGGTSDGMEARVARLEAHVEILRGDSAATRADVADIRLSLATLTERIAHLPSKGFVVTSNMTAIALFSGVILFGEKLKALIGA